ncbi:S66 peptidase family protein [Streptomyces sp. NBC_00576]|uniref:S66 peptidase family protein n=1 Tax=Streptomyces sp. NBC_00576 TaxID=2903665 RepID=UPI002E823FBD|nr:LD-carboxypeptidase [Streptomyces sp. NBC_00576]WUB72726.1 LD-carboxypeptidase [Streptomyces sp. NBC_00576]
MTTPEPQVQKSSVRPLTRGPVRTLGLWTPSSPAPALFPRRTARALAALRHAGWDHRAAESFAGVSRASAAHPRELAAELHALVETGVDAVLASAGGWTAGLVLPYLDFGLLRAAQVPLIGYSDVSVLLWAFAAQGIPAVHGPMLVSEFGHFTGPFPYTLDGLRNALAGTGGVLRPPTHSTEDNPWWDREDERALRTSPASPWRVIQHGHARGRLLAGCLPAVTSLFGTPHMPPTDGKVLFLEDFGMAPDRFLSLLAQWHNSGRLQRLAGLVLGRRGRASAAPGGYADFDDALLHLLDGTSMPVVADVDFGHTEPRLSLPLGAEVDVNTDPLRLHVAGHAGTHLRNDRDNREKEETRGMLP